MSAPPPPLLRLVDATTVSGYSALHFAIGCRSIVAVRALLSYDPLLTAYNKFEAMEFWVPVQLKSTPLHVAAHVGDEVCCMALLRHYVSCCWGGGAHVGNEVCCRGAGRAGARFAHSSCCHPAVPLWLYRATPDQPDDARGCCTRCC